MHGHASGSRHERHLTRRRCYLPSVGGEFACEALLIDGRRDRKQRRKSRPHGPEFTCDARQAHAVVVRRFAATRQQAEPRPRHGRRVRCNEVDNHVAGRTCGDLPAPQERRGCLVANEDARRTPQERPFERAVRGDVHALRGTDEDRVQTGA